MYYLDICKYNLIYKGYKNKFEKMQDDPDDDDLSYLTKLFEKREIDDAFPLFDTKHFLFNKLNYADQGWISEQLNKKELINENISNLISNADVINCGYCSR